MYKRWLMVLPGIVLLATAFNTAWNLVQSEIWRYQTENFLSHWQKNALADPNYSINKADWQVTLDGANKALENMPGDPDLHLLKSKVLVWGVKSGWPATATDNEPAELAVLQQAILLRPGWPYSWSDYAVARSQRSLIDQQLEQALVRADQLGPWEQQVMENASILGRYYRGWLSEPVQNMLDDSQQRLAKLYPHRAKQIERQYPLP